MIRNEVCVYDKQDSVIEYINSIVLSKDFDFVELKYGDNLSENQKYLIVKNLYSLYIQNALYEQSHDKSSQSLLNYNEFPSALQLAQFRRDINFDERQLETKIGVSVNGIKRILTNGELGKLSTIVATLLKNLGYTTTGYTAGKVLETNVDTGVLKLTEKQEEDVRKAIEKGENARGEKLTERQKQAVINDDGKTHPFTIAQMKNVDNLRDREGNVTGILVYYTNIQNFIDGRKTPPVVAYAQESGIPTLINPDPQQLRSLIYSLDHDENGQHVNKIHTIYIESSVTSTGGIAPKGSLYDKLTEKAVTSMFDALFRPYSLQDSLKPADRAEKYLNFDFSESKRHLSISRMFNPMERIKTTLVISKLFSSILTNEINRETRKLENQKLQFGSWTSFLTSAFNVENFDKTQKELKDDEDYLEKLKTSDGRKAFLRKHTPRYVFEQIRVNWIHWLNKSHEEKFNGFRYVNNDTSKINPNFRNLSDKEIDEMIKERERIFSLALYRNQLEGIDNFAALCEEASIFIARSENIKLDFSEGNQDIEENPYMQAAYDEDENGNFQIEDINSMGTKEEQPKDGWMVNFRETSSFDSLSNIVRKMIDNIPLLDKNNRVVYFCGFPRYLDSNYVHALLIDKLHNIYDDEDVLPTLNKISGQYNWVKAIVNQINFSELRQKPNESIQQFNDRKKLSMLLFSAFTHDMNKYFTPFWIQKKQIDSMGQEKWVTIPVNRPEGTNYLFDSWRGSYESGEQLVSENSVIKSLYDEKSMIVQANAKWNYDGKDNQYRLTLLKNLYKNASTQAEIDKYVDIVIQYMKSVGINTDENILKATLSTRQKVFDIIDELGNITNGIVNMNPDDVPDMDLINTFGGAYNSIAEKINDFDENAVESSVRQGTKQYYSHTVPNYLGNFMKKIQNLQPEKKIPDTWIKEYQNMSEDFRNFYPKPDDYYHYFIFHEFGRFDWFYRIQYVHDLENPDKLVAVGGKWLSDWIKDLNDGTKEDRFKYVKEIKHKVLLSHDGYEYKDWDPLMHAVLLWNEYNSQKTNNTENNYSYYHIPTLSDANSAEFIRFRRFVNGVVKKNDATGFYTYQELIREKLHDVVIQEYNRIDLVRKRQELPKKMKIKYFDGERGTQFNFLPLLNNYIVTEKIDDKHIKETKFIDKLDELYNSKASEEEIRSVIYDAIDNIMSDGFDSAMLEWNDIKLFELDGTYTSKHILLKDSRVNDKFKEAIKLINGIIEKNGIKLNDDAVKVKNRLNALINEISQAEENEQYNYLIYTDRALNTLIDSIENLKSQMDQQTYDDIISNLKAKDNIRENMREYYWNTVFAETLIIQLFTTDLAFYKNPEDFIKRIKEIHAPNSNLNVHAQYISSVKPNEKQNVGREFERAVYINDEEANSMIHDELEQALESRRLKGMLSDIDKQFILSNYFNSEGDAITVTDGQGLRSFSSYRRIRIMAGDWTDEQERAYWNIKDGNWNINDFMVVYQTQKPYMYTLVGLESGMSDNGYIKSPVQHKNSEFMLAAMFDIVSNELGKSSKLKALNMFMEECDIDVIQFASCVKVGLQGAIDFDDKLIKEKGYTKEREMIDYLKSQCFIDGDKERPNNVTVHTISYSDWGIQQATPEHLIDHVQLFGTQIRKLVRQDMDDDSLIEYDGKKLSKKQWIYLFDAINTENILQAFQQISPIFKDINKIHDLLMDEMRGNPRYTLDDQESIRVENGLFVLPICDPAKANKIQALINSILRKRITELLINGGSAIQVTAYGGTDDLQIRWKTKDGNFIFNEEEFKTGKVQKSQKKLVSEMYRKYNGDYKAYKKDNIAHSIAYVECYMPAVSSLMFDKSIKKDLKGIYSMNIDQIDEDMRKVIGYRIPTENKYSMLPLYIKGFMPQQNGSTIMLPNDWVNQSGSDFDVDKLYLMLQSPESRSKYKKAKFQFDDEVNDRIRGKVNFASGNSMSNEDFEKIVSQLKYMSKQERDNMLIDMMYGVLTNETSVSSLTRPGNYQRLSKEAKIFDIIENIPFNKLVEKLYEYDRRLLNKDKQYIKNNLFDIMHGLSSSVINELSDQYKRFNWLMSPTSQLYFHNQNMAGLTLVGIYANGTSHHALMQEKKLMIKGDLNITINGKRAKYFDEKYDFYNELISTNLAEPQAASVDNIKDPVLAKLNQNRFTANIMPTLLRLGYSLSDVNYFLKQPVIMEITNRFLRKDGQIDAIMDSVEAEYRSLDHLIPEGLRSKTHETQFSRNFLAKQIILSHDPRVKPYNLTNLKNTQDLEDITSYYHNQLDVLDMFRKIYKISKAMTEFVQATRSDTKSGGAGPLIADTESKILRWEKIARDPNFPITAEEDSLSNIQLLNMLDEYYGKDDENDTIRFELYNSKVSFLQSFYTFGLEGSRYLFKDYFPQLQDPFKLIVHLIEELTNYPIDALTLNDIYNSFFDYAATSTRFFGDSEDATSFEKRNFFINEFPFEFYRFVNQKYTNGEYVHPELVNNEFIKRLKVQYMDKSHIAIKGLDEYKGLTVITFRNVGLLTAIQKDKYMHAWEDMLYSNDLAVRNLAIALFKYSFYRHGFKFGPMSFMHLCPTAVKTSCPEYVKLLRNLTNENWVKENLTNVIDLTNPTQLLLQNNMGTFTHDGQKLYSGNFADQYIRNNMTNYKFVVLNIVPKLKKQNKNPKNLSSINFLNNNGGISDVVRFMITDVKDITVQDKRLLMHTEYNDDGKTIKHYVLAPYFQVRINRETAYFKVTNPIIGIHDVVEYRRVYPLGYPNQFVEYDHNQSPDSMESVIWFQSREGIRQQQIKRYNEIIEENKPLNPKDKRRSEMSVYDYIIYKNTTTEGSESNDLYDDSNDYSYLASEDDVQPQNFGEGYVSIDEVSAIMFGSNQQNNTDSEQQQVKFSDLSKNIEEADKRNICIDKTQQ